MMFEPPLRGAIQLTLRRMSVAVYSILVVGAIGVYGTLAIQVVSWSP